MKIPINKLRNNTGQLDGIPANPRSISIDDYNKLIKSLKDDPEYLNHELLHVIEHGDTYVVLNGNQRLRALKELGYKEVPATVYPKDTPPDVIRARIIKSNHSYGTDDWDALSSGEWGEVDELLDFGLELPKDWGNDGSEPEQGDKLPCPTCGTKVDASKLD